MLKDVLSDALRDLIVGVSIWLAWNWLLVPDASGLATITWPQAMGIVILIECFRRIVPGRPKDSD